MFAFSLIFLVILVSVVCVVESAEDNNIRTLESPVPDYLLRRSPLLLNIGGVLPTAQWVNVNVQVSDKYIEDSRLRNDSDYVLRYMDNLHGFPNGSVSVIYSSHALEHTSMVNGETLRTLEEWRRVLRPGGLLMVSVPDFELLARLYLEPSFTDAVRLRLNTIMFGGQQDEYDYHLVCF